MRANEFLNEAKKGKISKRKQVSTRGLNKFRDREFADRIYELNRIMMAAACTDGLTIPDVTHESWAGRYDIAAPYTQEEQDMLNLAYRAVGSAFTDLNNGDLRSQELDSTNKQSIVVPFKGFK